jgi:hypothetical protein
MNDGISLTNISHPKPSVLTRLRFMFHRNRLSDAAIETMEIEIPERPERKLGPRQIQWCRAKLIFEGRHIFTEMEGTREDDRRQQEALLRHGGKPSFAMHVGRPMTAMPESVGYDV